MANFYNKKYCNTSQKARLSKLTTVRKSLGKQWGRGYLKYWFTKWT